MSGLSAGPERLGEGAARFRRLPDGTPGSCGTAAIVALKCPGHQSYFFSNTPKYKSIYIWRQDCCEKKKQWPIPQTGFPRKVPGRIREERGRQIFAEKKMRTKEANPNAFRLTFQLEVVHLPCRTRQPDAILFTSN